MQYRKLAMYRTGPDVARRAMVFGALGFRASLEVTTHPQSEAYCARLLPWLGQLNLARDLEDLHREILSSPYGELPREYQSEAYWRGEAAALLGWSIALLDKPHPSEFIDPGLLVRHLRLLQPSAGELISTAQLRPQRELDDFCAFCMTVRHNFQRNVLPDESRTFLDRIHSSRLAELGLREAAGRVPPAEVAAVATAPTNVKGLYTVRGFTAEWLLGAEYE